MKFNSIAHELLLFTKNIRILHHDNPSEMDLVFSSEFARTHLHGENYIAIERDGEKNLVKASELFLEKTKNTLKMSEIVSENFVKDKLETIAIDSFLLHPSTKDVEINKGLEEFYNSIHTSQFLFYIGIGNLSVAREYEFGLIKIIPLSEITNEKYFHDKPDQKFIQEYFVGQNAELRSKKIFAIAEISIDVADGKRGFEIAHALLRQHLNILRCFDLNGTFIEGDPVRDFYDYVRFSVEEKSSGHSMGNRESGNYYNPSNFDNFTKNEELFKKINQYFVDSPHNEMGQKIINSLDWLGGSILENDLHEKLLKLIISLESLLIDDGESAKRLLLGERVAFLSGKNYEKRIDLINVVNYAYELRNKIVHTGGKTTISPRVLSRLFWIILNLNVMIILNGDFNSFKDIRNFVEKQKFGYDFSRMVE